MKIEGGCHCGNIAYELEWPGDPARIPVRECGCTFCRQHRGAWTSHPHGALRVTIADRSLLSHYRFGTATADFQVCARCGVVPLVLSRIDQRVYAVVNVNSFSGVDAASLQRSAADFDREGMEQRLARRKRNWIGEVQMR